MEGVQTHGWRTALAGSQMLFVAFGALVLMPLITGMNPSVALFTAGIGTLLFQLVTKRQVPVFLASSFAFIAPIIAAKGDFGLPAVLGGVVAAGIVYMFLGFAVRLKGPGFIDRLLPPVSFPLASPYHLSRSIWRWAKPVTAALSWSLMRQQ